MCMRPSPLTIMLSFMQVPTDIARLGERATEHARVMCNLKGGSDVRFPLSATISYRVHPCESRLQAAG